MIVFIDENISPHLARGLNTLQQPMNQNLKEIIEVRPTKNIFVQGVKDEDWIPQAGAKDACVITQDYHIKRT